MLRGAELDGAVRELAGQAGRIVVAGGDGTVSSAARALAGTDVELALLPLGTLNHLARDLGIPSDLEAAARIAAQGASIQIDIGEVNGVGFVNNASIGLYPAMVRRRDARRRSSSLPKWLAALPASWDVLARIRHHRLRVDMGEGERPLVTPLLFIGNNEYSLEAGSLGSRRSLQDGRLWIFAVTRRRRLPLIWLALRMLLGKVDRNSDFVAIGDCRSISVRSPAGTIEIALDGEVEHLASPLQFRIIPATLRVVVPAEP